MEILDIADSVELTAEWREQRLAETEAMRKAMEGEEGLLNIPQTATLLGVSRARVCELMKLRALKRFEFFGQIYLSFREVCARRKQDVKAGRPARGPLSKPATALKAAALTDRNQFKQGGFDGPYDKKKTLEDKERQRRKN